MAGAIADWPKLMRQSYELSLLLLVFAFGVMAEKEEEEEEEDDDEDILPHNSNRKMRF